MIALSFQVEIKKAVFVENNSADEGVSLSATPASEDNAAAATEVIFKKTEQKTPDIVVEAKKDSTEAEDEDDDPIGDDDETQAMLEAAGKPGPPPVTSTASSSNHEQFTEHRVNAVVSQPPKEPLRENFSDPLHSQAAAASVASASASAQQHQYFFQQMQVGPSIPTTRKPQIPAFGHPLANVLPPHPAAAVSAAASSVQPQQQRRTALRTVREKDVVTTVTHQDINGVNTVALKDLDVQMTAGMSGYETYV